MPYWVKIAAEAPRDPKLLHARALGGWGTVGVWVGCLAYCNEQLTDGFVPSHWAVVERAEAEIPHLVAAELLAEDATRDGWIVVNYEKYQRTKAQIEAESAAKSAAGRRGGKQTASKRQAEAKQKPSSQVAELKPVAVAVAVADAETEEHAAAQRVTRAPAELQPKDLM